MIRRLPLCAAVVLVALCSPGWSESAARGDDPYQVPEGGVAELIAFIQRVSEIRPETPQEDIRHRQNARPALRQAAERILELDSDPASETRQTARFLVMVERVRSLAADDPQQTVEDVQTYLAELIESGQQRVAADVAMLLVQTLMQAGQWHHCADACESIPPLFADAANGRSLSELRGIAAGAEQIREMADRSEAAGSRSVIRPEGRLVTLDLSGKWNRKMVDFSGSGAFEGNGLAELPRGEQTLRGVAFSIGDGVVQLGSTNAQDSPARIEGIAVERRIARLYALHATQWGGATPVVEDGTPVGEYRLHYEDGTDVSLPIVYGEDVRDWWTWDRGEPLLRGSVAWTGANLHTERYRIALRLCLSVLENPHPERKVHTVSYISTMDTPAAPFCVALTVEEAHCG